MSRKEPNSSVKRQKVLKKKLKNRKRKLKSRKKKSLLQPGKKQRPFTKEPRKRLTA